MAKSKVEIVVRLAEEAEVDDMGLSVGRQRAQRWLRHTSDHHRRKILAYVFGRRQLDVKPQVGNSFPVSFGPDTM